jgi:hypothetical protein
MTITDHNAAPRLAGALLLTAIALLITSASIVVPAGLTLNPDDPAGALRAVHGRPGLHLVELALDVSGWLALAAAALALAVHAVASGRFAALLPAGLLALAGAAGMLHDAGNLAVTQLAATPDVAAVLPVVEGLLLQAKWAVNLAGLLWVAATGAAALWSTESTVLRRFGFVAALSGLAAVVLPWTTGTGGPTPALEQLGYALHLPVMAWWAVLGGRCVRAAPEAVGRRG